MYAQITIKTNIFYKQLIKMLSIVFSLLSKFIGYTLYSNLIDDAVSVYNLKCSDIIL